MTTMEVATECAGDCPLAEEMRGALFMPCNCQQLPFLPYMPQKPFPGHRMSVAPISSIAGPCFFYEQQCFSTRGDFENLPPVLRPGSAISGDIFGPSLG